MVHRLGAVALLTAALTGAAAPISTVPSSPSNSDLAVYRLDPAPVKPGGTTTVHAFVANLGPDRTASPFTVTVDLPVGAKAVGPFFPVGCRTEAGGVVVQCTFPAGLPALETATALVPVRISPNASGRLTGLIAVTSPDDRNPANNLTPFQISVERGGRVGPQ
jgi:hypothetical protein